VLVALVGAALVFLATLVALPLNAAQAEETQANCVVPSVIGYTHSEAIHILEGYDFTGSHADENLIYSTDLVNSQEPRPQTSVACNTFFDLHFVRAALCVRTVPHVLGLTVKQAMDRISAVALIPRMVATGNMNFVWRQFPEPGVQLPCREVVEITPLPIGTDPL
jgi:beta-lactam-binding protein with PASTA domain